MMEIFAVDALHELVPKFIDTETPNFSPTIYPQVYHELTCLLLSSHEYCNILTKVSS